LRNPVRRTNAWQYVEPGSLDQDGPSSKASGIGEHKRDVSGTPVEPGTRKVVGATGFEPATPCAQERGLAMSRDVMRKHDWLKSLIPNDLTHIIARHRATKSRTGTPLEPRSSPIFSPVTGP
jgi:hypothetical protein